MRLLTYVMAPALAALLAACGGGGGGASSGNPPPPGGGPVNPPPPPTLQWSTIQSESGRTSLDYWMANFWVNDLVWDPHSSTLYLAVAQNSQRSPQSIVALDPSTGTVRTTLATATAPKLLAVSANGEFLYAAMADDNLVRRFRLPSLTPDLDIDVGPPSARFRQLAVAPNNARTLAIAGAELDVLGNRTFGELAIYDDAVRRSKIIDITVDVPFQTVPPTIPGIAWDASGNTIYSAGRLEFSVDAQGLTPQRLRYNAYFGAPALHDNVIYADDGRVYDLASDTLRGAWPDVSLVTARTQRVEHGKAFSSSIYHQGGHERGNLLSSFAIDDLTRIDMMVLDGDEWTAVTRMVPWGTDGIAMARATDAVAILKGSFVRQETVNRFVTTPATFEGTVTSGVESASYRVISLGANAALTDPCTGEVYIAMSSYSPVVPNSIVAFDPVNGTVLRQLSAPGEPINMALADDCSMLYVGFDTSDTVLRARTPALTRDLVIPIKAPYDDAAFARRIDVLPGNPRTILLTKGTLDDGFFCRTVDYGVGVLDDAVERPQTYFEYPATAQDVVWGRDEFEAFGGSAHDGPSRYTIDATGILDTEPLGGGPFNVLNGLHYFDRSTGRIYDRNLSTYDVAGNVELARFQTDWTPSMLVNQCTLDTVVTTRGSGNVYYAHWKHDPQGRLDEGGFPLIGVEVEVFDWQTQSSLSKLYVGHQLGFPVGVAAWGSDGLAVVTSFGYVILLQGEAVAH